MTCMPVSFSVRLKSTCIAKDEPVYGFPFFRASIDVSRRAVLEVIARGEARAERVADLPLENPACSPGWTR
jgi:hypothetical protein